MESLNSGRANLFDPIRRREVRATPEERVRQHLIRALLARGVPASAILVEVSLRRLFPEILGGARLDLAVALPTFGGWDVRLLAECKAHAIGMPALAQLQAYQSHLKSRWYLLASSQEVWSWNTTSAEPIWVQDIPNSFDLGFSSL